MVQIEILRGRLLGRIARTRTDINSLKDHSQSYESGARSLSSAGVSQHVIEDALRSSKSTIAFLTHLIGVDLENIRVEDRKQYEGNRLTSQINFLQRSFQGILVTHQMVEGRYRRVHAQDRERLDEEIAEAIGAPQEPTSQAMVR
jgi:hypothetical protein